MPREAPLPAVVVRLNFGACAPSLQDQLRGFGLALNSMDAKRHEGDRHAINRLRLRHLIPESQSNKAFRKLFNAILKDAKCVEAGTNAA